MHQTMHQQLNQRIGLWLRLALLLRHIAANIADILRNSAIETLELGMMVIVGIIGIGLMLPAVSFPASVTAGTGSLLTAQTEFAWGAVGFCVGLIKLFALSVDYDAPRRPMMRQIASAIMFAFWLATGAQFYLINPAAPGFFWCVALDVLQGFLFSRQAALHAPPKSPSHESRA